MPLAVKRYMKRFLRIIEEPRDFGCAGLIIVIILLVLFHKCGSCTNSLNTKSEALSTESETAFTAKTPAANWRFGATAAVAPQKRQCEIER